MSSNQLQTSMYFKLVCESGSCRTKGCSNQVCLLIYPFWYQWQTRSTIIFSDMEKNTIRHYSLITFLKEDKCICLKGMSYDKIMSFSKRKGDWTVTERWLNGDRDLPFNNNSRPSSGLSVWCWLSWCDCEIKNINLNVSVKT